MSALPNQTNLNPTTSFFAAAGSGGGGSNFVNIFVDSNAYIKGTVTAGIVQTENLLANAGILTSTIVCYQDASFNTVFGSNITTGNINLTTINSGPYVPGGRGVGASVDLVRTISTSSPAVYIGQNNYFNLDVPFGSSNPALSIDPGGTVGGNYVLLSGNSTGNPPIQVQAQGTPIDYVNPNTAQAQLYMFSGGGASLGFSGWHRIGNNFTSIYDSSMPGWPLAILGSNMPSIAVNPLGILPYYVCVGNQYQACISGSIDYAGGTQSPNDFVIVGVCDSMGNGIMAGSMVIPNGFVNSIPFAFTGMCPLAGSGSINYDHLGYQIHSPAGASYKITIYGASIQSI